MPIHPPAPCWRDVFADPDTVGQSEYRALVELLADGTNTPNIGGEVDPDTTLTRESRDHMLSMLAETVAQAKELSKTLRALYPRGTVK